MESPSASSQACSQAGRCRAINDRSSLSERVSAESAGRDSGMKKMGVFGSGMFAFILEPQKTSVKGGYRLLSLALNC
jgi:hypothetical protein